MSAGYGIDHESYRTAASVIDDEGGRHRAIAVDGTGGIGVARKRAATTTHRIDQIARIRRYGEAGGVTLVNNRTNWRNGAVCAGRGADCESYRTATSVVADEVGRHCAIGGDRGFP